LEDNKVPDSPHRYPSNSRGFEKTRRFTIVLVIMSMSKNGQGKNAYRLTEMSMLHIQKCPVKKCLHTKIPVAKEKYGHEKKIF